jgi:hypothetical protein
MIVTLKVSHRRTFIYLEQLILKHQVHSNALKIKECSDGLDFYYSDKATARKLVDFLTASVPCRSVRCPVGVQLVTCLINVVQTKNFSTARLPRHPQ